VPTQEGSEGVLSNFSVNVDCQTVYEEQNMETVIMVAF
jgi:hypothetical protein